ncbi:hypothetical protein Pr1d_32190 [Bythopirellula goksoeyrii]|uniref:Uncharacterized protein n=1 Tax=Bythopirellula goksoeyrii TaxID=1400387 RepID=A0A5B9QEJ2_9BACT|nr:hypothetical protein Pr1d_32190 [Bythopirellula goksoeyrii]
MRRCSDAGNLLYLKRVIVTIGTGTNKFWILRSRCVRCLGIIGFSASEHTHLLTDNFQFGSFLAIFFPGVLFETPVD